MTDHINLSTRDGELLKYAKSFLLIHTAEGYELNSGQVLAVVHQTLTLLEQSPEGLSLQQLSVSLSSAGLDDAAIKFVLAAVGLPKLDEVGQDIVLVSGDFEPFLDTTNQQSEA